jgi:hypothetical protein
MDGGKTDFESDDDLSLSKTREEMEHVGVPRGSDLVVAERVTLSCIEPGRD